MHSLCIGPHSPFTSSRPSSRWPTCRAYSCMNASAHMRGLRVVLDRPVGGRTVDAYRTRLLTLRRELRGINGARGALVSHMRRISGACLAATTRWTMSIGGRSSSRVALTSPQPMNATNRVSAAKRESRPRGEVPNRNCSPLNEQDEDQYSQPATGGSCRHLLSRFTACRTRGPGF